MRDALIDPRAGDVVRAAQFERVVVNRCENGDVVFRYSNKLREYSVTLYQWREAMRICKYEAVAK